MTSGTKDMARPTTWTTAHGEVTATPDLLRQIFNAPTASDFEVYQFIQLCKAQSLNPFLRDAYLIKYGDKPASFVTGKETFTQRAEAHEDYDGMEAGVIVQRDGTVEYLKGTFHLPTDSLVGGWTRVHRKNWSTPVDKSVTFSEYDSGRSLWKSKPATMIEKVAIVQALREAFPRTFAGLYDSSEVGQDLPAPNPVKLDESPAQSQAASPPPRNGSDPAGAARARSWHKRLSNNNDPDLATMGRGQLDQVIDHLGLSSDQVTRILNGKSIEDWQAEASESRTNLVTARYIVEAVMTRENGS